MILNTLLKRLLKFILNSSYILLLIYFLDGIILKMKKFVIQRRKFEFKRSYIFKDMNFWSFWILMDSSRIYFEFYRFYFLFKIAKRGYLSAGTVGDVAQAPRECDMTRKATSQGHASPRRCLRGAEVAQTCGGMECVGSKAHWRVHVNLMDLGPSDHHFNTCVNCDNRRPWSDTWMHPDCSIKVWWAKGKGDRGPVSWARTPPISRKSDSANRITKQTARILC